jgi:putative ABC transport system permease protein
MTPFPLDLRKALRTLLRAPGFTLTAVLTLALGMGIATAMATALHQLLLRPLPFPDPGRLVSLWEDHPGRGLTHLSISEANFQDWQEQSTRTFEGMAGMEAVALDVAGGDVPQRLDGLRVSPGFFGLLGVRPFLGSFFPPQGADAQAPAGVVVSHELWARRFGGDRGAIGKVLLLDGSPHTVLGVLPQGFRFSQRSRAAFFLPLVRPATDEARGFHQVEAVGRLRPGVTAASATAELEKVCAALAILHPDTNQGFVPRLAALGGEQMRDASLSLLLLMGAVAVLLLIACTNVACLFLARALGREREVAIRMALGAQNRQVLALFLSEGLVVGLAGAALGLLGARMLLGLLPALLPGGFRGAGFALSAWSFLFSLGVALAVSFLVALPPMLQHRMTVNTRTPARKGRLRALLVQAEVALAVLLLVSAGLLMRSLVRVLQTAPGLDPRGVVQFEIQLPGPRYAQEDARERFRAELEGRMRTLPGVTAVGISYGSFLGGADPIGTLHVGDTTVPFIKWPHIVRPGLVSPGLFEALRIPLRSGRPLLATDTAATARVLVVNETLARTVFPAGSPLGQKVRLSTWCDTSGEATLWEIVGVVGDVRHRSLEAPPEPAYYLPAAQFPASRMVVYLRGRHPAGALKSAILANVQAMDGALAVRGLTDMETFVRDSLGDRRDFLALLGGFAALALLLAGLGIHGVVAFAVNQRTWEIGVRMALGARARTILAMVLEQGLRHALAGCLVGAVAALGAGRLLASRLVGVGTVDPLTLAAVTLLLACVAVLACLLPALRAVRVDPATALRAE